MKKKQVFLKGEELKLVVQTDDELRGSTEAQYKRKKDYYEL